MVLLLLQHNKSNGLVDCLHDCTNDRMGRMEYHGRKDLFIHLATYLSYT